MRERKAFMNYGSPKRHDGRIEEAKYYRQQAELSLSDLENEQVAQDILDSMNEDLEGVLSDKRTES